MNPLRRFINRLIQPRLDTGDGVLTQKQIHNRTILGEGSLTSKKSSAPGVKTYWASQSKWMNRDRKAFIDAQTTPCCAHGRQFTMSYATTLEFVREYRLCACCGIIRKEKEYADGAGDSRLCTICACDELAIEGLAGDEAVQHETLLRYGWLPVSPAEAAELERQLIEQTGHRHTRWQHSLKAIKHAQKSGETIWRDLDEERRGIEYETERKRKDFERYSQPEPEGRYATPAEVRDRMLQQSQEPVKELEHLYLATTAHAVNDNAWTRYREIKDSDTDS